MAVRKYWTLAQIRQKVKADLDLEAETFVRPAELNGYINEAIDQCEAEIHALYDDYFLSRGTISLVQGTEEYDLPADIYAHKIRRIVYDNNNTTYTVTRIRDWKKFEKYEIEDNYENSSDYYRFFVINTTAGSPQILLSPKARTTGEVLKIWYIRQANRLENDSDICDIPEFVNFVMQYTKVRVYEKEGHPNMQMAMQVLESQRNLMLGTLATMVPDAENKIELDYSYYEDMTHNYLDEGD